MRPIILLSLLCILLAPAANAQVPQTFSYQGMVTDDLGGPLSDGSHDFLFKLYPLPNAVWPVWEETQTLTTVGGVFHASLGEVVPFTTVFPGGTATFDIQYWLGVAIDGGPEVIRLPLESAPYALRAGALDDNTVTDPKIVDGTLVRSLNGLRDDLTLTGANGINVSNVGNTITVTGSGGGGGADSDWAVNGSDMYALPSGFVGIGTTTPSRDLHIVGSGINGTQLEIFDESSAQSWSQSTLRLKAYGGYSGYLAMTTTTSGNKTFTISASAAGTRMSISAGDKIGMYYDTFLELGTGTNDIKGTLDATGKLSLFNPSDVGTIELIPNQSGGGLIGLEHSSGVRTLQLFGANTNGSEIEMRNVNNTRVFQLNAGTSSTNRDALMALYNPSGVQTVVMRSNSDTGANQGGGYFALKSENAVTTIKFEAQEDASATQGAAMKFYNDSGVQTVEIDADYGSSNQGRVITDVLEITGGSDLSENFDVTSDGAEPEPGNVVCIDPHNPGRLVVAGSPYDRTVAGVVSGAGGVRPGMLMGQRGSEADGKLPIALSGRVYVWCDTSAGPIQAGDLLTTSSTPGHAQRVEDFSRAQGAILGKAMTGLDEGRGLVMVLVSLQ